MNKLEIKLEDLQKSVKKYLLDFWQVLQGKDKKDLDEALIQQGESEEEKRIIAEQCEETDLEHDLMEELWASKKDPGEWLEQKIEETAKEVNPNATQDDIDILKDAVADSMEAEIGKNADELAEEAALIAGTVEKEESTKKEE